MDISSGKDNDTEGIKAEGNNEITLRQIIEHGRYIVFFTIVCLIVGLSLPVSIQQASNPSFGSTDAWTSSLTWMKDNTPDPFGDPNTYYQLTELPPEGSYQYPESAYGVLAWWDYTYQISRIAHRLPVINPGELDASVWFGRQTENSSEISAPKTTRAAWFFITQNESNANNIAQGFNIKYVIVDKQTAYIEPETAEGKFPSVAMYAGQSQSRYFEVYYILQDGQLFPKLLFYPDYYLTMAVRLYCFEGKAVTPRDIIVIGYQENSVVTSVEQFSTYRKAEAYISSQEMGNYRIVGTDPFVSPVPLEKLNNYRLVHKSGDNTVKIFEYLPSEKPLDSTNNNDKDTPEEGSP